MNQKRNEIILGALWFLTFLGTFLLSIFSWREEKVSNQIANFGLYLLSFSFSFSLFLFFLEKKKNKNLIFFLIFLNFLIFSTGWSKTREFTYIFSLWSLMITFPGAFLSLSLENPKKILLEIIKTICSFGLFSSLFGLFVFYFGEINYENGVFFQKLSLFKTEIYQMVNIFPSFFIPLSFFNNKNSFGFFLALSLFCNFFLLNFERKIFYFLSFFLQLLFFLMLSSRASLLFLFFSIFSFYFFLFLKKMKVFGQLVFFLMFLLSFIFFVLNKDIWFLGLAGLNKRTDLWRNCFEEWMKKPFFGNGFGSSFRINFEKIGEYLSCHNTFLNSLTEFGLVGFLFFIFVWFYPIFIGIRKIRKEKVKENTFFLAFLLSHQFGMLFEEFLETRIFYHLIYSSVWPFFTFVLLNQNLTFYSNNSPIK